MDTLSGWAARNIERMAEARRTAMAHGICPQCLENPAAHGESLPVNGLSSAIVAVLCESGRSEWRNG